MILEIAQLHIRSGQEKQFEASYIEASKIISAMHGYISHELMRCLETEGHYMLLVNWQSLEDHTVGFRNSPQFQEWKRLLHHFYEPLPTVQHYEAVGGLKKNPAPHAAPGTQ